MCLLNGLAVGDFPKVQWDGKGRISLDEKEHLCECSMVLCEVVIKEGVLSTSSEMLITCW